MIIKIKASNFCIGCGEKLKKREWVKIFKNGSVVHEKCQDKIKKDNKNAGLRKK
jgi:hypothetical protein